MRKNRFHAPVRAHAGPNFLGLTAFGLAHPEGVSDQGAGHANKIAVACAQDGFSLIRRGDAAHADHRQIDIGLDLSRGSHLKPVLFRRGRVDHHPVQIGALRARDVVELARGGKVLGNFGPLLRAQAALHAVIAVQAQAHDGIRAHLLARRVNDAHDNSHAVFE